jgi:hypothetical protein
MCAFLGYDRMVPLVAARAAEGGLSLVERPGELKMNTQVQVTFALQ